MRSGGQGFSRHPDVLEVTDEIVRRPTSRPLSVSPCAPRARPAPRSAVGHHAHGAGRRGRRPLPPILPRRGPAREGPAPPSARDVPRRGGAQFIATGAGGHPAGQHGARGDTKARRRLRVGLHTRQSRSIGFLDWGHTNPVAQKCAPSRFVVGRPAPGAARVLRAPGLQEVGDIGRRAFVADEVADEAARKPASKPFSVSPCLPVLRVNRPEARSPVRSRRSAPLPVHCRTSRAEGGPPRTSAPTTHPAPTRPGARRTRAAFGAGRPNGSGAGRPQAGGSQFIATGAGRHPAGQHGARGDTKARRRLRVGLHARQSRSIGFLDWGHTNPVAQKCAPSRFAVGRPAPGAARVLRAPGRQEVGDIGRRAFVADEVADEAARKPASKPFSVSPVPPRAPC